MPFLGSVDEARLVAMSAPGPARLLSRRSECAALDQLVASVREGPSRALVLRGRGGRRQDRAAGPSGRRAAGCRRGPGGRRRVRDGARVRGAAPAVRTVAGPPGSTCPDRSATRWPRRSVSARATPPDRFLVGLAGAEPAGRRRRRTAARLRRRRRPVARRGLGADAGVRRAASAGRVASRWSSPSARPVTTIALAGLAELHVDGLADEDARALLASVIPGPLDERVRDRIVAETRGNPLALLELPRGRTPAELAGGFGLPDDPAAVRAGSSRASCGGCEPLPPDTRLLLLVAAAEPVGDVAVWRARRRARHRGGRRGAAAEAAELVEIGAQVRFRHPLVRSAVYGRRSPDERQRVHRALAEATDPDVDPDRRAWHRAQATAGPDEDVAAELERSAGRARARGGLAAEAAFLERAAELTPDPSAPGAACARRRCRPRPRPARPMRRCGCSRSARAGPLDELEQARAQLLHAQITFARARGRDAAAAAARGGQAARAARCRRSRVRPTWRRSPPRSSPTAWRRAVDAREVAAAVLAADWTPSARACDLLLDGLSHLYSRGLPGRGTDVEGGAARVPREPLSERGRSSAGCGWPAGSPRDLGDDAAWDELTARQLRTRSPGRRALDCCPLRSSTARVVRCSPGGSRWQGRWPPRPMPIVAATGSHCALRHRDRAGQLARDGTPSQALIEARREDVLRAARELLARRP